MVEIGPSVIFLVPLVFLMQDVHFTALYRKSVSDATSGQSDRHAADISSHGIDHRCVHVYQYCRICLAVPCSLKKGQRHRMSYVVNEGVLRR